jgi:hypothetical protein
VAAGRAYPVVFGCAGAGGGAGACAGGGAELPASLLWDAPPADLGAGAAGWGGAAWGPAAAAGAGGGGGVAAAGCEAEVGAAG